MVTIVVLIVILAIIALIVILLHFSLTASVHIGADGFSIKAKYLGLELYPRKQKPKKEKKPSSRKKKEKSEKSKPEPEDFGDDIEDEISDYELMHGVSEEHEKKLISEEAAKPAENSHTSKAETKVEKKYRAKKVKVNKDVKKKKEEPKKSAKPDKPEKSSGLRGKISDLRAKYNKLKPYIPMTWKYFTKLLKKIRITVDNASVTVGREDAHEAAIYYGAVQGLIANVLSVLSEVFDVRVKKCGVECVFIENTVGAEADLSVKLRPSTVISIAVCFAVNFLIINRKNKNQNQSDKICDEKPEAA